MTRLKLTSPGVLMIVAVVLAGGILMLDGFYLRPYVQRQADSALTDQALRIEHTVRHCLESDQATLGAVCQRLVERADTDARVDWADPPAALADFATREIARTEIPAAWVTDSKGHVLAVWSRMRGQTDHEDQDAALRKVMGDPPEAGKVIEQAVRQMNFPAGSPPPGGLIRLGAVAGMFGCGPLPAARGADGKSCHLWLLMPLDAPHLQRITDTVGGEVLIVHADSLPGTALEQATASQALWRTDDDTMAVAWRATDPAGNVLGYFRARFSVSQILAQATATRRIALIVLSLSVGLVCLVIMGVHILVTGPVVRLLTRLQDLDAGQGQPTDLTHRLHGEPLVLARRLESAFERLAHMSKTDQLTSLANRRHFEEVLACFYHQSRRYNRPLSLVVMDVDFFKAVNDSAGHQAGDELLKFVAAAIEDACRKADLPARLGGDEFAVLLPETLAADAASVADRIHATVNEQAIHVNGLDLNVTLSVGVADLNSGEICSPEAMVALADRALYAAKEAGRNRTCMAHDLEGGTGTADHPERQKVDVLCRKLAGLDSRFKEVFLQAVEEVVKIIEQRDPYMADHARKVQRYSVLLAREMGLPDRVIKRIEIAAMLHDIGMLALPDTVLLSSEKLTGTQLADMRRHTLLGVRMMERMEFLEQEIPAVRYHHERFDGKGYPEGISGSSIPLTARILAVADTFDAMTSSRAFRKALPLAQAIEELRRSAGSQLDPACVEAFVGLAGRVGEDLIAKPEPASTRWRASDGPLAAALAADAEDASAV